MRGGVQSIRTSGARGLAAVAALACLALAGLVVAGLILSGLAPRPAAAAEAACQSADGMIENFISLYPTGGPVARFDGETGDRVLGNMAFGPEADEVVFLYSGNGPVTGARGRYMYLLLDAGDCILTHGWIDGATFDRVVPAQ